MVPVLPGANLNLDGSGPARCVTSAAAAGWQHIARHRPHRNIIRCLGSWSETGVCHLVLPRMRTTLHALLRRQGSPPPTQRWLSNCRYAARCVASAMAHLHENGIVFRDLQPNNVLIFRYGRCRGHVVCSVLCSVSHADV